MIREAVPSDLEAVASLAARLWPAHAPEDLKPEIAELIAARDAAIFLLFDDDGSPTGFAQCQLRRDYVEGTGTSPVGYLEGIYVDETQRRRDADAGARCWPHARGGRRDAAAPSSQATANLTTTRAWPST